MSDEAKAPVVAGVPGRPKRRALPWRRQGVTHELEFIDPLTGAEMVLIVRGGIDPVDGTVREIFIQLSGRAAKNSLLERICHSGATGASLSLQFGMTVYELADTLGRYQSGTSLDSVDPILEAAVAACRMQAEINGWPPGAATLQPPPRVPKNGETK